MAQFELTPYQRDILVKTALGEARGEGVDGMAAVVNNIINRANSGRYPNDPAAVALQPKQYSTWNTGEGGNNPQQFKPGTKAYETAAEVVDGIASGTIPDNTGGALFYHASNITPSWSNGVKSNGTLKVGNHTFYPTHPVPPGELPSVASLLDTQRAAPTPAIQSPNAAFLRQNTSPLGDNTGLQAALQQVATTKANEVTPAIRRPALGPMTTPDVNSLYAGIYPQASQGKLTDPGAVNASVAAAGANTNSALKAALARIAGGSNAVPQSQIERTPPPVGQSQIERGTTPYVADTAVSRKPRVTVSTPYTTPQRMAGEDEGNVARVLPLSAPFVPEERYIEPRNAVAPIGGYLGPFVPDKGLERLASPAGLSVDPVQTVKRMPAGSVVAPTAFTTELRPMQIANPAWKATPAAGTPQSGGLSRDAVALRSQGQAAAQRMAQVPRMITVQRPVQVAIQPRPVAAALARQPLRIAVNGAGVAPQPITVAQGLSPSAAYAAANQAAAQAAAQGGKYYRPDSYENRYAQNSGGGGAPRSLLD